MTLLKPLKNFFNILLTETRLSLKRVGPERDLQYHRAKSLMITLLQTGHFSRRHSREGTPCVDMILRGSVSIPEGRSTRVPVMKLQYLLIQGLLLVLFVPVTGLLFSLLYPILLFVGSSDHSHSPPLFAGNPPRYVFDPSALEGSNERAKARARVEQGGRVEKRQRSRL